MPEEDADRHRQAHDVAAHEVNRLLEELTEDQLRALSFMIDGIAVAQEPRHIASYMAGKITMTQQHRFNICAACGHNHEKELLGDDHQSIEPPAEEDDHESVPDGQFTELGSVLPLAPFEGQLMEQYGLDDLRDESTGELLGFICLNCNQRYATIQDRMVNPPGVEHCSGCVQKTKWG